MKKFILIVLAVIFFLLDWAALHDIIKANENSYVIEYFVLFISLIYFSVIFYFIHANKNNSVKQT